MIWYSTMAPGIAFGLEMPLTGSELTIDSLTMVSGTVAALVQVHVTELFSGMSNCRVRPRSEEHTSELQSLMRISYAVFCLKKKTSNTINKSITTSSETI